jgi:F-type H+-transporting ATPase subunit b
MCESPRMRFDCHDRPAHVRIRAMALAAAIVVSAAVFPATLAAQESHEAATASETEAPHGQTLVQSIAKVVNFAILGGVLFYFLKTPIGTYLVTRSTQIRQDLVTAAELRSTASAQLADIERKLQALPAELEKLRVQGEQDVKAEQARITKAAADERERLIAQTHREIEARLRVAKRQLTEHAADLAIKIAEDRIKRTITPDDQLRLVDRYAAQLREAQ